MDIIVKLEDNHERRDGTRLHDGFKNCVPGLIVFIIDENI